MDELKKLSRFDNVMARGTTVFQQGHLVYNLYMIVILAFTIGSLLIMPL